MGVTIAAIGKGSPGENGVPGETFTNIELLNRLKTGLNFWQRAGLSLSSKSQSAAERALEIFEKKTGIKRRQMYVSDTLFPNECLATAACIDAIERLKVIKPEFDANRIKGFIMVTDTNDMVFPVSGKAVAKVLGIRPKHYGNSSVACSSIVNAIQQACSWIVFDPKLNVGDCILIVACDITSRLHQPNALKQPFLFGDQAVALILEKTNGTGGFSVSNVFLDTAAPDIVHFPLYTGDSPASKSNFSGSNFGNDTNLRDFGKYEERALAGLYRIFTSATSIGNNGTPILENGTRADDVFILPQVSKNVVKKSAQLAELNCPSFQSQLARSTVPNYGIIGAAGTPLAMYFLNGVQPLSNTRFTAFISAIGGVDALFTYDPKAGTVISYGDYDVTPEAVSFSTGNGHDDEGNGEKLLPNIPVDINKKAKANGKGVILPEQVTIDDIAFAIEHDLKKALVLV